LYGSSDNWVGIARELMSNNCVYLLDLRNHGSSPHTEEHNYSVMTDDVLEFFNDNNIYSALVMGHSMGGKVAMSFAALYPDRVKKLIVVDISPRGYAMTEGDKQISEHTIILESLKRIRLGEIVSRNQVGDLLSQTIKNENVRLFLLKNLVRSKENVYSWKINLSVLYESLENVVVGLEGEFDDLKSFCNPALFIKGGDSPYIQEKDVVLIKEIFKDVCVETIAGASHWVHAEKTKEFLQIVNRFIRN
jgi:pimeloyl-ACP methyl ester carboxylesterase